MSYDMTIITRQDAAYPSSLLARLGPQSPQSLTIIGDCSVLQRPLLGLFCSIACPGDVILQMFDLAIALRDAEVPVISGFASPMERECEHFMMRGNQPLILCLARHPERMRISQDWAKRIDTGRLVIVSPFTPTTQRISASTAFTRNLCAVAISSALLIAHAAYGGETEHLVEYTKSWDIPRYTVASRENAELIHHGFLEISTNDVHSWWSH